MFYTYIPCFVWVTCIHIGFPWRKIICINGRLEEVNMNITDLNVISKTTSGMKKSGEKIK